MSWFDYQEKEEKEAQEWARANGHYTGKPCENCGRNRVEERKNGKEVCEKCHWVKGEGYECPEHCH